MVRNDPNRRKVIKTAAVIGSASIAGTSIASGSTAGFRSTIEHSQVIKQSTGSIEAWLDYLEKHDVYGETKNQIYSPDKGITTKKVEKSELDINITLLEDCDTDEYYAELSWEYENNPWGEPPQDGVGLAYDSDWWKLAYDNIYDTTSTSTYVEPKEEWGYDFEGPGYAVEDQYAAGDSTESYHYAGVYLVEREDSVDPSDREIQGNYVHTWDEIDITGGSVGFPAGISLSVSENDKKWDTKTEQDGDLLRISQAEASDSHCGGLDS
ncbi:MAG: hypothetical protein ACI80F_001061 [Natronomonas sp.]|jgi:hypothetical protein|uniref:hypothetical protein n=2 Tax=Natronomonas sp. TaxID=2184060 RepID=UPI003989E867